MTFQTVDLPFIGIVEVITDLIKCRSQAKRPDSKPRGPAKDLEQIGVIDLTSDEELTEVEVAMNNNELLSEVPA